MRPSAQQRDRSRAARRMLLSGAVLLALVGAGSCAVLASKRGSAFARNLAKAAVRYVRGTSALAVAPPAPSERAWEPLVVFAEDLGDGWQDWSWAERDLKSEKHARTGRRAIAMTVE